MVLLVGEYIQRLKQKLVSAKLLETIGLALYIITLEIFLAILSLPMYINKRYITNYKFFNEAGMSYCLFQIRRRWTLISFSGLVTIFLFATIVSLVFNSSGTYAAFTWTERQPNGNNDTQLTALAIDSDGSNLIAARNTSLYTSADYGATWSTRTPTGSVAWATADTDATGTHLIAGATASRLYTSADSGATWTERTPTGSAVDKNWIISSSDSAGQHLLSAVSGGRLYTSADYGASWTERTPTGSAADNWWTCGSSDSDGSFLIAGINGGRLYFSTSSGAYWSETQPAGATNKVWISVAADATGANLIAAVSGGRVYTSANSGTSWTERTPSGSAADKAWRKVASDSTGTHLLAVTVNSVSDGRVYSSSDSGVTWTEQRPAGDFHKTWRQAALDSNGAHMAVAEARLYTGTDPAPIAPTSITTSSVTTDSVTVSWTDNSSDETGFVVQKSIDGNTYTTVVTTTANATSYAVGSLSMGTAYWFRVAASNASGNSSYVTTASSVTTLSNTAPTTPASFSVTPVRDASGYVTVQATLNDADLNALKVKTEYRSGNCAAYSGQVTSTLIAPVTATYGQSDIALSNFAVGGYQLSAVTTTPGANAISYSWNSKADVPGANGQYCVYVTANDSSLDSTVVSSTVTLDNVYPTAPGSLTVNALTANTSTLNFGAATTETNFKEYKIFYKAGATGVTVGDTAVTSSTDSNLGSISYSSASTASIGGLSANTQYVANIWAYDTYGQIMPAATEVAFYTYANAPSTPTVTASSTSVMHLVINQNSNSAITTYSICKTSDGTTCDADGYVQQSTGTLGASADYQTYTAWGGASGVDINGLTANASYRFLVKARNYNNVETAFSSANTAVHTYAPQVSSVTVTSSSNTTTLQLDLAYTAASPVSTGLKIEQDSACDGTYDTTVYSNTSANPASPYNINSGISANTCYQFRFSSYNADGTLNTVSPAATAQITTAPAQVSNLHTTNVDTTQITWAWNAVTGAAAYDIYRSVLGTLLGTVSAPTVQFLNSELSANTAYSIIVRARNENGSGIASSVATATTDSSAPTSVTRLSSTVDSITWGWDNSGQSGFYGQNSTVTARNSDWILTNSWQETGLSANTQYTLQVKAKNSDNVDTAYTEASAYTSQNAPTSISFSAVSSTAISITVNGTFPNLGTGSAVIHFDNGAGTTQNNNSSQTWRNTSLTPNTQYSYTVYATNGDGDLTGTQTSAKYTLANAPIISSATSAATSSVTLIIDLNSNPAATELAVCSTSDGSTCAVAGNVQSNGTISSSAAAWKSYTLWGGASGITITGLTPATGYRFLVKARNGESVETSYSSPNTIVYTLAQPPLAPTVTMASQTTLNLVINTNGNGTSTTYLICKTTDGTTCTSAGYIQSDGSSSANTDSWQTFANWGGASGQTITGLTVNTAYKFIVKTKTSEGITSTFSDASSWVYTDVAASASVARERRTEVAAAQPTIVVDGNQESGLSTTVSEVDIPATIDKETPVTMDLSRALANQQVTFGSSLTISRAVAGNGTYTLYIPNATTITADSGDWDGQITLPTLAEATVISTPKGTVQKVIEVGSTGIQFNFNAPVKLTFSGQGSSAAAYQRNSGESVIISTECAGVDDPSNIIGSGECYKKSGDDMVVWTKHFTKYYTYTSSSGNGGIASAAQPVFFTRAESGGGGIITVNNGANETGSRTVTIDMNIAGARTVAISNNSDFDRASFIPFKNKFSWTLTPGDGLKTIYVRFRDKNGGTADAFAGIMLREAKKAEVLENKTVSETVPASSEAQFAPVRGLLAKSFDQPTVYLFFGDAWHHIVSETVFNALQYSWDWVKTLAPADMVVYPVGSEINKSDSADLPTLNEVQNAALTTVVPTKSASGTAPVAGTNTSTVIYSVMFEKDIKPGQQGSDVEKLQKKLFDLGYLKSKVFGYYGPQTVSAVKKLQNANKIQATGAVGAKTRALLNSL